MKLTFITTNKHKVEEIQAVLKDYGIEIEQAVMDYPEDKEKEMTEIAKESAKNLAEQLQKPVITEDTGLYFKAYNNFPGALPKFIFQGIGFAGILKLLEGKDREACFKTVIGYCEPGNESVIFAGEMQGRIAEKVILPEADAMPYDHIFIPDGYEKAIVEMTIDEKNKFSQRGKAARELGEYLRKKPTL
ncbi:MAG: non-canonical purine NTP pyrophosphatase [Patescibacteria group bacterium]|jgi:non-canonical purine NTP pyrophosphatase (RdgB/HAM1 family)